MEMMNRAIEDASDFGGMLKKLQENIPLREDSNLAAKLRREVDEMAAQDIERVAPPKRPGENREQYRARIRSLQCR
jgi:hypothetical protein